MKSKVITIDSDFMDLMEVWNNLYQKDTDCSFFSSFDYNYLWWKHNKSKNDALFIILIYQQNEIVGIAPLYIKYFNRKFIKYNQLRFLGFGDTLNFVINADNTKKKTIVKEILKVIQNKSERWDTLFLANIDSRTDLFQYLKSHEYNEYLEFKNEMPYFPEPKLNNQSYFRTILPKNINNLKNKLEKYDYKFKVYNNESITLDLFKEIISLYTKKQKILEKKFGRNNRKNLFLDDDIKEFFKDLFPRSKKNIFIFGLEVNKKIISYNIAFRKKNSLVSWNTGYDPDFYKFRLNKIRMAHVLEYCSQNNINYFWGSGGYKWKFTWTRDFIPLYSLNFPNSKSVICKRILFLKKIYLLKKVFWGIF